MENIHELSTPPLNAKLTQISSFPHAVSSIISWKREHPQKNNPEIWQLYKPELDIYLLPSSQEEGRGNGEEKQ